MRGGVRTERVALAAIGAAAAPWREALQDLNEDVLAETAAEARAFGAGPAAAVDELVRGPLGQLAHGQQSIGEPVRALTTAAKGRPPPGWTTDAGRTENIGWHQAPHHAARGRRTPPPRSPARRHRRARR
ncbi:hypothetical protein ACIP8Z_05280 [Streptomyces sp. NPDC088553]|uniref:hypothetical protein n=1 Tax=Streptomyces sp. NPDC088553 TaxID=3365864 RepID=UPI00381794C3